MKFSIITVCYNAAATIVDTMKSVNDLKYDAVEHIVIDGGSTDGSIDIIRHHIGSSGIFISEPDKGIYDAMNKGVDLSSGDIIAILNADDVYQNPDILTTVRNEFNRRDVDAILCDVAFFRDQNTKKVVRRYNSGRFSRSRLAWGWMPAHPGMFLKKRAYDQVGPYRTDFRIAADYEFIVRAFYTHRLSYFHLPEIAAMMRLGGVSTSGIRSNLKINEEVIRACRQNGLYSNHLMLLAKYPEKLIEIF